MDTAGCAADRRRSIRSARILTGDSLKRPPGGYAKDHALIEDLKRKDFIAVTNLDEAMGVQPDFLAQFANLCRTSAPFMGWLCKAVKVAF